MNPYGTGWHLGRAAFDEFLREVVRGVCEATGEKNNEAMLTGDRGISKIAKARFQSVKRDEELWTVEIEDLKDRGIAVYKAKWVIDATGRKASVAQKVSIHKLGLVVLKLINR